MRTGTEFFSLHTYKSNYDYTPLKLVFIYINLTYLLHFMLNESPSFLGFLFMTMINLSIVIGYVLPNYSESSFMKRKAGLNLIWKKKDININWIIIVCSILSILSFINTILSYYPSLNEIAYYLQNPGQAYIYTQFISQNPDNFEINGGFGSVVSIVLTLLSATKYIFLMFTLLYWKQLKNTIRLLSVSTLILYLISSFLVGSMITIGSVLLSFIPLLLISFKHKRNVINEQTINLKKPKPFKIILSAVLGLFIVLYFISNRMDKDNNLFEGVKVLGFYISHGYVGLDYCLALPFETTYGQTTFRGISALFVKYWEVPDLFNTSYLGRNQDVNGYPALSLWSTIFPWLASDFSFYSLPLIMGVISYQFSLIWNKVIRTGNPYGYLLLGQFFIFWFMVPANNQLFHTLGNAASFIVILYLYLKSKRYYKIL